jgi:hypothetical protein
MLTMILVIPNMNYNVVSLFLKIVTTWHWERMPKFRPWALKTALGRVKNVFLSSKNVVHNVVKYL